MDDKFLRDKINESDIEVPESLLPENISKKLDADVKKSKKNKMNRIVRYAGNFALAAAAVVVVVAGAGSGERANEKTGSGAGMYENEAVHGQDETTAQETQAAGSMYNSKYNELYEILIKRSGYYDGYYITNDSSDSDRGESVTMAGEDGNVMYPESDDIVYDDESLNEDGTDFSKNNDQEEGVSEGNIFITDGSYLYVMKKPDDVYVGVREVSICEADGGKLTECSQIQLEKIEGYEYVDYNTMYVDGDMLVIAGNAYNDYICEAGAISFGIFYDISDRAVPSYVNTVTQSGYYVSSRITDGVLYMVSHYMPDYSCEAWNYRAYIPAYNSELVGENDIYMPQYINDRSYTVIGSVDLNSPMSYKDTEAVVSGTDNMYVSENAIYFLSYQPYMWYGYEILDDAQDDEGRTDAADTDNQSVQKTKSRLIKFFIDNGNIEYAGEAEVYGSADSQFSFSEYNGYIRLVTTTYDYTDYEQSCGLYIFDGDMKLVGSIDELAKGESIKSSRFLGDMVYFVTFKNTDPLFAVDMTDPSNPVIVDEIKLPGFSEYLHPYGDGRLFGLGYEADESNGRVSNVKMSMFDISNPYDISEESRLQLDSYYSGALYEHRAILVNAQRNLIGFSTEENIIEKDETGANIVGKLAQIYRLYRYDENEGFVELIECVLDVYSYDYPRANYIGDYLYIFDGAESIYIYELNDYSLLGVTEL